jgi:endonuclease G
MKSRHLATLFLTLFFVAGFSSEVSAQHTGEIHSEHLWMGMPRGTEATNDLIIRDLYAASTNDATKFADWVAFRLTPREVYGTLDLERRWREDPWLEPEETLEPGGTDDYSGAYATAGYDRGHLAPLGSFTGSVEASSLNYYSNIVPQTRELNRGPWRTLEDQVRNLVLLHREVYVVTGTLYDGPPMPVLPEADEPHTVPTGFFKVIVIPGGDDTSDGRPVVTAYIMPQRITRGASPERYRATVDEVERRAGLDLFWQLKDEEELRLEASAP